jgi:hypothetical protein
VSANLESGVGEYAPRVVGEASFVWKCDAEH